METAAAVARAFGNYRRLDRFRQVCILANPAVPQDTVDRRIVAVHAANVPSLRSIVYT